MVGKILGNRYRLLELIGEGGMALVYKAEDSLLCRAVAVKILRPQYASDAEFVERFHREAKAAASLAHPNVVNIFDVGKEDDIDYIVMEYIPGENLKDLIKRNVPMAVEQALDITRQIGEALHHAHQRNIIHRDIKPHNILVTPEGQIKVTDFGIARAISASSFTQAGMVIGSVQYSSPEQVKGGVVGPQSDIYSLGCVLYELLTGTIPFQGDTSISIAMQHLQGSLIPIRELRPDIPVAIERIVEQAMAKDINQRYPSALAMLKEINLADSKDYRKYKLINNTDLPTQTWESVEDSEKPSPEKRHRWWKWMIFGFAISMIIVGIISVIFLSFTNHWSSNRVVEVPDVVGEELVDARQILKERRLNIKVINYLYNSEFPNGTVISQQPAPGQKRRASTEIEVVVSKGLQLVRVPNLAGKNQLEAELVLEETGLTLGEILVDSSPEYPEGVVIKQLPDKNTQIEHGASVSITLNVTSANLVKIPNYIGRPLSEVRAELGPLGLMFNQATPTPSNIYPEGVIIDQRPLPYDRVPLGTAMNFIISSGPE
ncbi:MAG: Stk1 family PASTA domain-containing Ser/Thr kinase [Firmicutes bacterium]|nr:Stk1 family PASTA domain-containing Ser/Thr kinase [Bacillota bacterium]